MEEENVLATIPSEGESLNLGQAETPADSPAENPTAEVVEEPAEGGENTPLEEQEDYKEKTSKRVKQLLAERHEERSKREALEARLAALESKNQPAEAIPERWSKLFSTGDPEQDQTAYQEWKLLNEEEKKAWKAEMLEELRQEEAKTTAEEEAKTAAYNEQMDELEAQGKTFDRNELMKAMAERPIWTTDGQPDWETKLELLEAKKTGPNTQARKSLAAIKPQGSIGTKGYATPDDLRGGFASL